LRWVQSAPAQPPKGSRRPKWRSNSQCPRNHPGIRFVGPLRRRPHHRAAPPQWRAGPHEQGSTRRRPASCGGRTSHCLLYPSRLVSNGLTPVPALIRSLFKFKFSRGCPIATVSGRFARRLSLRKERHGHGNLPAGRENTPLQPLSPIRSQRHAEMRGDAIGGFPEKGPQRLGYQS
jgi:hypothetical protein